MKTIKYILMVVSLVLLALGVIACDIGEETTTFTVTFVCHEGSEITPGSAKVIEGQTVLPPIVTKEGHEIGGWYLDGDFNLEFDFNMPITEDVNIYVRWVPIQIIITHLVTFDSAGGSLVTSVNIEQDNTIQAPTNPNKAGHTFSHWALDGDEFDFNTPITASIELVAVWQINTFTVTFDSGGGTTVDPITSVAWNTVISAPTNITKAGHSLSHWTLNGVNFNFNTPITESIELVANWQINTFTVNFDTDGGSLVDPINDVEWNTTIQAPTNPTKTGHTFSHWTLDGTEFSFDTLITASIELVVHWQIHTFMVTFDSDGGSLVDPVTNVDWNTTIQRPTNPSKTGHTFSHWTLDGEIFNFSTRITKDIELVASWNVDTFTVTFDSDGGSLVNPITNVVWNTTILAPANPTKTGHTFSHWTLDGTTFNFSSKITTSIELVANWQINQYTVTFDSDGGSLVDSVTDIDWNTTIQRPTNPTKTGHTFSHWTLDGVAFNFSTTITESIKLVANWNINTFTVTFDSAGGTLVDPVTNVEWNTIIQVPTEPTKTGYFFQYWILDGVEFNFNTSITASIELVASWQAIYWYSIMITVPSINNVNASYLGNLTLSILRDGVHIDVVIEPNYQGQFIFSDLRLGDIVTITYLDDGTADTLLSVNPDFNQMFSGITLNNQLVTTTANHEFVVDATTAALGSVPTHNLGVVFTQLQNIEITTNLENFVLIDGDLSLVLIADGLELSAFYALAGTQVTLSAPEIVMGGTDNLREFEFEGFTSQQASITNANQNPGAFFIVGNNNIIVIANYASSSFKVEVRINEDHTNVDGPHLLHNAIAFNGREDTISTARTTFIYLRPGQNHIDLINGRPNPTISQIQSAATYYAINTATSSFRGATFDGLSRTGAASNPIHEFRGTLHNFSGMEIGRLTFDVMADMIGDNVIIINFNIVTHRNIGTAANANSVLTTTTLPGSGTANDPFRIGSFEVLHAVGEAITRNFNTNRPVRNAGAHFILTADITNRIPGGLDIPGVFNPIGNINNPFRGHFDGNGFVIHDVTIQSGTTAQNRQNLGLFGVVDTNATINMVVLENARVINNNIAELVTPASGVPHYTTYVGGLVGLNRGTISNSAVTNAPNTDYSVVRSAILGTTPTNAFVGGLVGANAGMIISSMSRAAVTADYTAGGLVGISLEGDVIGSYNSGDVTAPNVAGLVGRNGTGITSASNTITYSYNVGQLTSTNNGQTFGITHNFNNTGQGEGAMFNNTFFLIGTATHGIQHFDATGIPINQTQFGAISQSNLEQATVLTESNNQNVNFVFISGEDTFAAWRQCNLGFPVIITIVRTYIVTIEARLNGSLIDCLQDISMVTVGTPDWSITAPINTEIHVPIGVEFAFEIASVDDPYVFISNVTRRVGTNFATTIVSSVNDGTVVAQTIAPHSQNVHFVINFNTIEVFIHYLLPCGFDNPITSTVIRRGELVDNFIPFQTAYKNLVITGVQFVPGGPSITNLWFLEDFVNYSAPGIRVAARHNMIDGFDGGEIRVSSNTQSLHFRILTAVRTTVELENLDRNTVTITQCDGNNQILFGEFNTSTSQTIYLPTGRFDTTAQNSPITMFTYELRLQRETLGNVIDIIDIGNQRAYTNPNRDLSNRLLTFDLSSVVAGTDIQILSATHNSLNILASFEYLYHITTVVVDLTTFTTTTPTLILNASNIHNGESQVALNSNDVVTFNIEFNTFSLFEIEGKTISLDDMLIIEIDGKTYRAIWVIGEKLETAISRQQALFEFGLDHDFLSPLKNSRDLVIHLYLVELFAVSVEEIATLHYTSFYTSLGTEDHQMPRAHIIEVEPSLLNGKALPGAVANIANTNFMDFGATVEFAATRAHLHDPMDHDRFTFHNWHNNTNQTTESAFSLNVTQSINITAYYVITTVDVWVGTTGTVGTEASGIMPQLIVAGVDNGILGDMFNDFVFAAPRRFDRMMHNGQTLFAVQRELVGFDTSNPGWIGIVNLRLYHRIVRIPFGETFEAISQDQNRDLRTVQLFERTTVFDIVTGMPQGFIPAAGTEFDAYGRFMGTNGYFDGIRGQILSETVIFFEYFNRITLNINANLPVESAHLLDDGRFEVSVTEPNGTTRVYDGATRQIVHNDTADIIFRFLISELNGENLNHLVFDKYVVGLQDGAGMITSTEFSVSNNVYTISQVEINENIYMQISYTKQAFGRRNHTNTTHSITIHFVDA